MVRALDDGMVDMGAEQRLKVPPNSIEAEQSLIGGLMLDALAWDKVADVIISDDFYRKIIVWIFLPLQRLIEAGSPCDVVTVSEHLDGRGELEKVGGLEYLAHSPTKLQAPRTPGPMPKFFASAQPCAP